MNINRNFVRFAVASGFAWASIVSSGPVGLAQEAVGGMKVAVFPVVLDGVDIAAPAAKTLRTFFENRLNMEGVYGIVAGDSVVAASGDEAIFEACRDKLCRIRVARGAGADGYVVLTIKADGGACRVTAGMSEVVTGESRGGASVSGGCGPNELKQSLMFLAAQISGQFGQDSGEGAVVADAAGADAAGAEAVVGGASAGADGEKSAQDGKVPEDLPPEPVRDATWIPISGGTFRMGWQDQADGCDAKPSHDVAVRAFEMTETEVTNAQYMACVEAEACTMPHWDDRACYIWEGGAWKSGVLPKSFRGINQPVVCIDIDQARAYAHWAGGRLPTEAEWEYAARGGQVVAYPWGQDLATCQTAVMNDGAVGCRRDATWPVCAKSAGNSAAGLCDMAGNVWEMVQDGYVNGYDGAPSDASAVVAPGSARQVIRGGSWRSDAAKLRSSARGSMLRGYRDGDVGFRLARDLPANEQQATGPAASPDAAGVEGGIAASPDAR